MEPTKTSLTAIFSLVFAFLCFPIGIILGIVAMMKINKSNGELGGKGLAIAGIVLSAGIALPGAGCLAAVAIPNFVKFQCRAKQSEAKTNLKSLFVAEESFRAEKDTYSNSLEEIEFKPRGGAKIRYVYSVVAGTDTFTGTATGQDDMSGDVWTIDQTNSLTNVAGNCQR